MKCPTCKQTIPPMTARAIRAGRSWSFLYFEEPYHSDIQERSIRCAKRSTALRRMARFMAKYKARFPDCRVDYEAVESDGGTHQNVDLYEVPDNPLHEYLP